MLSDGLQLLGSSTAVNFTIASGPDLPSSGNNEGELFFQTGVGLHVYSDGDWQLVGAGGGGGGSGSVTTVSVVSANGVSGSVANAGTTPAITLTLGAITPTSVAASGTVTGSNLSGTNTGDQTWATLSGKPTFATVATSGSYLDLSDRPPDSGPAFSGSFTDLTDLPTTLAGYGITNGQPLDADLTAIAGLAGTSGLLRKTGANTWALDTATYLTQNQTITLTGDVTGSGNGSFATTLANTTVAPGSYTNANITVDSKGRLTAAANGTGSAAAYDISAYVSGAPTTNQQILRFVAVRAFTIPAGATLSRAVAQTAATASTTFSLNKNGTQFGTFNFGAGSGSATFTVATGTSFAAGDILSIVAPTTPDSTLANVSVTLATT